MNTEYKSRYSYSAALIPISLNSYGENLTEAFGSAVFYGPLPIELNGKLLRFRVAKFHINFINSSENIGQLEIYPSLRMAEISNNAISDIDGFEITLHLTIGMRYEKMFANYTKNRLLTISLQPQAKLESTSNEFECRLQINSLLENHSLTQQQKFEPLIDAITLNLAQNQKVKRGGQVLKICEEFAENSTLSAFLAQPKGKEKIEEALSKLRQGIFKPVYINTGNLYGDENIWSFTGTQFIDAIKNIEDKDKYKDYYENPSFWKEIEFEYIIKNGENSHNGLDDNIFNIDTQQLNECVKIIYDIDESYSQTLECVIIKAFLYKSIIDHLRALEPTKTVFGSEISAEKFTARESKKNFKEKFTELIKFSIKEISIIGALFFFASSIINQDPISSWIITISLTIWRWSSDIISKNYDSKLIRKTADKTDSLINLYRYISQEDYDPNVALLMVEKDIKNLGTYFSPQLTLLLRKQVARAQIKSNI